ncbi:hypothetical protein [Bacteroides sp. AF25-38AC]|nr:hypothetical protein [Bacteroides sp. AF25-38AC]
MKCIMGTAAFMIRVPFPTATHSGYYCVWTGAIFRMRAGRGMGLWGK